MVPERRVTPMANGEFQSYAPFDPSSGQPCENCGHPFHRHMNYRCPEPRMPIRIALRRAISCALHPKRRRELRRVLAALKGAASAHRP